MEREKIHKRRAHSERERERENAPYLANARCSSVRESSRVQHRHLALFFSDVQNHDGRETPARGSFSRALFVERGRERDARRHFFANPALFLPFENEDTGLCGLRRLLLVLFELLFELFALFRGESAGAACRQRLAELGDALLQRHSLPNARCFLPTKKKSGSIGPSFKRARLVSGNRGNSPGGVPNSQKGRGPFRRERWNRNQGALDSFSE